MDAGQARDFARLVREADAGDGGAACRLGDMYREGKGGLRHSPREAFRWYARSALAGDPNGQNNLGACYEHGIGCSQSYENALKWYRLSANQRVGTAAMNLGYLYFYGHAVPADNEQALEWFENSAAWGEAKAIEMVEHLKKTVGRRPRVRFVDEMREGEQLWFLGASGGPPVDSERDSLRTPDEAKEES